MHEQKIGPSGAHKKCARAWSVTCSVNTTLTATWQSTTLVRMGQPFSLRNMLIDGQERLRLCRRRLPRSDALHRGSPLPHAVEMLNDIDKETVDFVPSATTRIEPSVLHKVPAALVNGSGGIAVGMACIPPHSLGDHRRHGGPHQEPGDAHRG
ncbi:MAG: DNA gyrase subunit A [Polyangiaceae bacterium]